MKIKDISNQLSETPYLHTGAAKFQDKLKEKVSLQWMENQEFLGTYHYNDVKANVFYYAVNFYFIRDKLVIYGFDSECQDKEQTPVFKLEFKNNLSLNYRLFKGVKPNRILQSSSGVVIDELQATGLTTFLYQLLVRKKYIIVSDSSQFEPGSALWVSLAKKSGKFYKVLVCDADYGPVNKETGEIQFYDGTNISRTKIWTSGNDYDGYNTLLVMFEDSYLLNMNW